MHVPSDPPTAGLDYILTCSIWRVGTIGRTVSIQWMAPDGTPIVSGGNHVISNLGSNSENPLNSTLRFSPARQSQAVGRYTCQATIDTYTASNFADVGEVTGKTQHYLTNYLF